MSFQSSLSDAEHQISQVSVVPCVDKTADVHASVFILDCIWEFFVLVGNDARGKRRDIRLALSVADVSIFFPSKPILG